VSASSPTRVHFDPDEMESRAFYRILNSVVVPRPIAWVCSRSAEGVVNLAPHSFYTVACVDPPVVQFTSVGRKDSLRNVEATGEFTVSLTPEPLFEQVNATGTDFPPDLSEAEHAGVRLEPSERVSVPRVAESPVAVECALHSTVRLGDSTVVFGRVLHISVWESAVRDGRPRIEHLKPLARLGGNEWSTIGEVKEIARIPYGTWSEDPTIGENLRR
jgi:flavin reductase (DIM6/NTAB) family NADH-FMN oxidoreductase RutF